MHKQEEYYEDQRDDFDTNYREETGADSLQPSFSDDQIVSFIEEVRLITKYPENMIAAAYRYLNLAAKDSAGHTFTGRNKTRQNDFSSSKTQGQTVRERALSTSGKLESSPQPGRKRGRPPKEPFQKSSVTTKYQGGKKGPTRQEMQRKFAQIFIEHGYGVTMAKRKANFQFQICLYYALTKNIIYRSFRKLEEKVRTECKVNVISNEEHKSLKFKTELCTFDHWLSPDEAQTFKEYIKSVYELNPQPVSKGKTVNLYNHIIERWGKVRLRDGRLKVRE